VHGDALLFAVGRQGNTDSLNLAAAGLGAASTLGDLRLDRRHTKTVAAKSGGTQQQTVRRVSNNETGIIEERRTAGGED
jgi:hypothetical protein